MTRPSNDKIYKDIREDFLKELCLNCGFTYGSHHGGTQPWPRDCCPGHEGKMDWDKGPGTIFQASGEYKEVVNDYN